MRVQTVTDIRHGQESLYSRCDTNDRQSNTSTSICHGEPWVYWPYFQSMDERLFTGAWETQTWQYSQNIHPSMSGDLQKLHPCSLLQEMQEVQLVRISSSQQLFWMNNCGERLCESCKFQGLPDSNKISYLNPMGFQKAIISDSIPTQHTMMCFGLR